VTLTGVKEDDGDKLAVLVTVWVMVTVEVWVTVELTVPVSVLEMVLD